LAWLHATPKQPGSKQAQNQNTKTRLESILENGGEVQLPEFEVAAYLVDYWKDVGSVTQGGYSPSPLSAMEIQAWQQMAGIVLGPWEFRVLRDMSRAYLGYLHEAEEFECPAPFGDYSKQFNRDHIAKQAKRVFGGLAETGIKKKGKTK
jgi:hypothetical protein